jgi:hypothetical protein
MEARILTLEGQFWIPGYRCSVFSFYKLDTGTHTSQVDTPSSQIQVPTPDADSPSLVRYRYPHQSDTDFHSQMLVPTPVRCRIPLVRYRYPHQSDANSL